MGVMKTEPPMSRLSPQQRAEANQLFSQGFQRAKDGDYAGAAEYYMQSAQYGHPGAQNNLGILYEKGQGVAQNFQRAFGLYLVSAQHSNTIAMRNVALCYQNGIGTAVDLDQAAAWLMTAAEQKDPDACVSLAKFYSGWKHRDREKELYWHKKAAEYGNADSMFFLGKHYAAKGEHQDLVQALIFYNSAAKAGTPKIKLKAAQALDCPPSGEEPALDLAKAKQLYIEVINCGGEEDQLAAAQGLDALYRHDETLLRDPLDMEKACMTYRILAMKGNRRACSLFAYCSEIGKGTAPNLDIAAMFYEKARELEKAQWCRRKKMGTLSDPVYEAHRGCLMPPLERSIHSHGKELYRQDVDSKMCIFNGRVYYIHAPWCSNAFLCSSRPDGTDVRILLELDNGSWGGETNVHVNSTGVYLYCVQPNETRWLWVLHTDFDGTRISEFKEEYQGPEYEQLIESIYFYDNYAYFVYKKYYEDEVCGAQIKRIDVDRRRVDVIYSRAARVERVFATDKKLIFYAKYENKSCDASMWGWMLLDLAAGTMECLSNPYCNPENILDHPEMFDEESPNYNEKSNFERNIVFFDLSRGIFWTERVEWTGTDSAHLKKIQYWEPRSLWGNRDQVLPYLPVWKTSSSFSHVGREYFDGTFHYCAEHYHSFTSSDSEGTVFDWSQENHGHGVCDRFVVTGDYLFLDIAAYGEEQYPLSVQKAQPLQKSWFQEKLPEDLVNAYRNKGCSALEEMFPLFPDPPSDPAAPSIADAAVKAQKKTPPAPVDGDLSVEKKIGETDVKYNICTFGAKFHIGFGVPVVIQIDGRRYECKTHKTAKGRIDGMKKIYAENGIVLGDVLKANYVRKDNVILIKKL